MKPYKECLYYLVREDANNDVTPGYLENDIWFDDVLEHIRRDGLHDLCEIELICLVNAARRRSRLEELDAAVEGKTAAKRGQLILF